MKTTIQKIILSLLSTIIFFSGITIVSADEDPENKAFTEFLDKEFVEMMEDDYMTMHYTVKDYASYGIEKPDISFGTATLESYNDAVTSLQESLDALHAFGYDTLSVSQQHDYDAYEKYLEDMIALNKYPLFDSYFNPSTGILDNIITNFTEFVFYEKEDFDDYLEALSTVPEYFDEALEITKYQAENGYFLSDTLVSEAIEWINDYTAKVEDNALIVVFDESVDAFTGLTDSEKESCKEKNKEIVLNEIIPAYENAAQVIDELRGSAKYEGGLANYPNGAEYYQALVSYKASTSDTVEELVEECEDYFDDLIDLLYTLYYVEPTIDDLYDEADFGLSDATEVLTYLQEHLNGYPEGPEVSYISSYLDESVANDSVLAYYVNPAIDDYKNNVIRINGETLGESEEDMFSTLAHEGFPGHLYQTTWYLDTDPHPIRSAISSMGYTEGWAMYAEFDALLDSPVSYTVGQYISFYTALNYVVDAYADLGVNGLGWTVDELSEKLDNIGLNGDVAQSLYDFVVEAPAQIIPYGIGLVKFQQLRGKASESLASSFNEETFNTVLLTYGPRSFEAVEEDVNDYITLRNGVVLENYDTFHDYENALFDLVEEETDYNYGDYHDNYNQTERVTWPIYAVVGGLVVVIVVAGVLLHKHKKNSNPFGE